MLNEVERPDLLMLGMLLHDIGKGKGHGHVAKGIPLIEALTARIGLPAEDADKVVFLVAHHLTLSHVAQRRDIDDPKTVGLPRGGGGQTPERLRMLYLLTFADMRAVGPGRDDRLAGAHPLGGVRAHARARSPAASSSGPAARRWPSG